MLRVLTQAPNGLHGRRRWSTYTRARWGPFLFDDALTGFARESMQRNGVSCARAAIENRDTHGPRSARRASGRRCSRRDKVKSYRVFNAKEKSTRGKAREGPRTVRRTGRAVACCALTHSQHVERHVRRGLPVLFGSSVLSRGANSSDREHVWTYRTRRETEVVGENKLFGGVRK